MTRLRARHRGSRRLRHRRGEIRAEARIKASVASAVPAEPATLTAIRREVLPDAVRVTLALEHETPFSSEQLQDPHGCSSTCRTPGRSMRSRTRRLTFEEDIVRQIRVGRQEGARRGWSWTSMARDARASMRSTIHIARGRFRAPPNTERGDGAAGRDKNPWTSTVGLKAAGSQCEHRAEPTRRASVVAERPTDERSRAGRRGSADGTGDRSAAAPKSAATEPTDDRTDTTLCQYARRVLAVAATRARRGAYRHRSGPRRPRSWRAGERSHRGGAGARRGAEAREAAAASTRVEVMLTRRTSTFVALEERTEIANRIGRRPVPVDSRQRQRATPAHGGSKPTS